MPAQPAFRIAIDSGGTFTDCIWLEGSRVRILKIFSTPSDPSRAIAEAVTRIASGDALVTVLHGTTVGTNTLLQRKGARVAFVTTAGFEDSIEIGRQHRSKLYDFFFQKEPPLASAEMRFGVEERTSAEGEILRAPDGARLAELVAQLAALKPQAIAISLLFSFTNPGNEQAVVRALQKLGVPLSVSHKVLPEFREYERASTALVNAYLQPIMESYLQRVRKRIGRSNLAHGNKAERNPGRIFVMQSSGGITALETAAEQPVRTVLSGPAGGVVGASAQARLSGFERIITFDMGGTSTDVALVEGTAATTNEAEVAGLPVRVPVLDIHTVGAGGGSLARFDAGGALRVGPESAGADPGPICYGRGELPTVTDANLLLGRLPADQFLGGEFHLDLPRTQKIVRQWLRDKGSRMSLQEFASGVVRVVNASMEKAIRVVSIERGYDSREFTLVAFGGAGGMHACELAQGLRIPKVLVPAYPGGLSALGILISDVLKDQSRTVLLRVHQLPEKELNRLYRELQRSVSVELAKEAWPGRAVFEKSCDLRYRGQGYELNLRFGKDLLQRFHTEHKRRYGYSTPGRQVEIVTVRLRARVASPERLPKMAGLAELKNKGECHFRGHQGTTAQVWFAGKNHRTAIRPRESLRHGRKYRGPAIVTEYSATTVVPPGLGFQIDKAANLIVNL